MVLRYFAAVIAGPGSGVNLWLKKKKKKKKDVFIQSLKCHNVKCRYKVLISRGQRELLLSLARPRTTVSQISSFYKLS